MSPSVYRRQRLGDVRVFDASVIPWHSTGNPGLRLKTVLSDDEKGEFLGLVGFDPFVRSGLHQHQGVATSFILVGGLTDYHGTILPNQVGINVRGSTHDALAYLPTVLVSRLEGPVTYPVDAGVLSGLHAGSRHESFRNPAPEVPPEVNVTIDAVPPSDSRIPGLQYQMVFDYAKTGSRRRMVQWRIRPETTVPMWRATEAVDLWIRGGAVVVNGETAHANCFVVIEPGALVSIDSPFGALVLAWANGREAWPEQTRGTSLFGF